METLASAPADVKEVVERLRHGIGSVLGENLVGLYLTGSLTYGDFDPGSSDIDYLAVMHQPLSAEQRAGLATLHERVANEHPTWRERIEGSYVTSDMLPAVDPPPQPRPYINQGAFWDPDPPYGNEWLINRYVLQECSIALSGPPFTDLVPLVAVDLVRAASARDLFTEWLPQVGDPSFLPDSHHEAYVTLTICRILHRQFNDEVVSKRGAAGWVRSRVGPGWQDLIDAALAWQHGDHLHRREQVEAFVQFAAATLRDPASVWTSGQPNGTDG